MGLARLKKILIIDDDQDIALFLKRYFEQKQLSVVVVVEAQAAERNIIEEQPDLIFLDNRMSPMTGKDILERLRFLKLQIPVVMMSAYKTMEGYYEMRRLGAVEYISKPYDFQELDRIVGQYLFSSL